MTTKIKTSKSDLIAEHEAQVLAAEAKVQEYADALASAEANRDELEAKLRSGDESVTPDQFAVTVAGAEMARILLEGSRSRVKRLKASAPFLPFLAESIAGPLSEALGVKVEVVDTLPDQPGKELPVLYLCQPHAAVPAASGGVPGTLRGQVRAHFHRPKYMSGSISPSAVREALERVQGKFTVSNSIGTSGQRDSFEITVDWIWPAMPKALGQITQHTLKGFGDFIGIAMKAESQQGEPRVMPGANNYELVTIYGMGSVVIDSELVNTKTASGIRRATVVVRWHAWSSIGFDYSRASIEARAEAVVKDWVGKASFGLGRCKSAELARERVDVGEVLKQTSDGTYRKQDVGTVDAYKGTFVFEAAV